jgi:hypothetical protein
MTASKTSIEARLTTAQVAIESALNDNELRDAFETYGYSSDHVQQGYTLHQRAVTLYQRQQAQYGQLYAGSDDASNLRKQAYNTYINHITLACVVFRANRGALQTLKLVGNRETSLAGWLLQARQFYSNALSNEMIGTKLAEYGLTRDKLEAGKQQISAVDADSVVQRQRKGVARLATKQRDEALAALDAWMRDFRIIARIALTDQPDLLKRLGITVRTS